ncbi:MAG: hypothetical protein ACP5U1_02430, partial [Desulfomonilaceae bacterium]
HPATIARWKKDDEWDLKLIQNISEKNQPHNEERDFLEIDMRQLNMLNSLIETHLQRKDLLPSEILELSQAKLNIMNCVEILNEQFRYFDIKEAELHEDPEFD